MIVDQINPNSIDENANVNHSELDGKEGTNYEKEDRMAYQFHKPTIGVRSGICEAVDFIDPLLFPCAPFFLDNQGRATTWVMIHSRWSSFMNMDNTQRTLSFFSLIPPHYLRQLDGIDDIFRAEDPYIAAKDLLLNLTTPAQSFSNSIQPTGVFGNNSTNQKMFSGNITGLFVQPTVTTPSNFGFSNATNESTGFDNVANTTFGFGNFSNATCSFGTTSNVTPSYGSSSDTGFGNVSSAHGISSTVFGTASTGFGTSNTTSDLSGLPNDGNSIFGATTSCSTNFPVTAPTTTAPGQFTFASAINLGNTSSALLTTSPTTTNPSGFQFVATSTSTINTANSEFSFSLPATITASTGSVFGSAQLSTTSSFGTTVNPAALSASTSSASALPTLPSGGAGPVKFNTLGTSIAIWKPDDSRCIPPRGFDFATGG